MIAVRGHEPHQFEALAPPDAIQQNENNLELGEDLYRGRKEHLRW